LLEENQKSKIGVDSTNKKKEHVGQKAGNSLRNTKTNKKAQGIYFI
jgi:hypothetical protein